MKKFTRFCFLLLLATSFCLAFSSCKKDCDKDEPTETKCTAPHPIIFLHGFLASGDTWANQVMRFESNNYCGTHLYA